MVLTNEVEKNHCKRNYILPVMVDNGHERAAVSGFQVRFEKFRDHLAGNVIIPDYTE